jgi:hypothetical protein
MSAREANLAWVIFDILLRAGYSINELDMRSFFNMAARCDELSFYNDCCRECRKLLQAPDPSIELISTSYSLDDLWEVISRYADWDLLCYPFKYHGAWTAAMMKPKNGPSASPIHTFSSPLIEVMVGFLQTVASFDRPVVPAKALQDVRDVMLECKMPVSNDWRPVGSTPWAEYVRRALKGRADV